MALKRRLPIPGYPKMTSATTEPETTWPKEIAKAVTWQGGVAHAVLQEDATRLQPLGLGEINEVLPLRGDHHPAHVQRPEAERGERDREAWGRIAMSITSMMNGKLKRGTVPIE